MKNTTERSKLVCDHFDFADLHYIGFKPTNDETAFPCRVCAAQVVDSGDALERHVAWHETLITTNATSIMRSPQS